MDFRNRTLLEKLSNNNLCNALWMHEGAQEYLPGYTYSIIFFWGGGRLICLLAPQSDFAHPTEIGIRSHCPSHAPNLNTIRPAVCEIWKTGVHVRTCRCTPPQTCVKHLSNGSLATHQIWTQSAQPFARSGKRVCTCARADALHLRHVASTYLMGP